MEDLAKVFAKLFQETKFEDLPEGVVEAAKHQVLDFIGVAVAGAVRTGAREVRELNEEFGGTEQATVWGSGKKLPVPYAAQCNSTAGHTLDFDDVHEVAVMHPGVVSIPTALGLADYLGGMSGRDLITVVVLGADMISRMNLGVHPGKPIIPFGWHTTTLNGSIVTANLAAKMLGLSYEQTLHAIGLGLHQTGCASQANIDSGYAKRVGPGFAVRNGIVGALLAQKGLTAGIDSLEGKWGFYRQFHGNDYDREMIIDGLGTRWESANVSIKPYPACRGTHNFTDAGIKLHEDHNIDPEQIERIEMLCGEGTYDLLGSPLETKTHPKVAPDAQFGIAWGAACGLVVGRATLKEYAEDEFGIFNPVIREVSAKITSIEYDKSMDNNGGYEGATVTVFMKDGKEYSVYLPLAKGSPSAPLTYAEVVTKYKGNLEAADKPIPAENGEKIIEFVQSLDSVEDARELNRLFVWA